MSFPLTNILDTFTRADNPNTLGALWSTDATHNDKAGILANRMYLPLSTNNAQQYWNVNTFANIVEVYITVNTLQGAGAGARLLMTTSLSSENGYEIFSNSPAGSISIFRVDSDVLSSALLSVVQAMTAGDSIGFSCNTVTGLLTLWYKSGAGAWTSLGTVTDTTYPTVKYLAFNVGNTVLRFSNFGGGFVLAAPKNISVIVNAPSIKISRNATASPSLATCSIIVKAPTVRSDPDGPRSPGTGANDASLGDVAWSNPGNIKVSDATYATSTITALQTTQWLEATNFGFNIAAGDTIDGIMVEIQRKSGLTSTIDDLSVKLMKAGIITGIDHQNDLRWPTSEAYFTYGDSLDLWGATLTPSDVNSSNFGVALRAATAAADTASVDHMRVTVYHTTYAGVNAQADATQVMTSVTVKAPTLINSKTTYPAQVFTSVIVKAPTLQISRSSTVSPATVLTTVLVKASTGQVSATRIVTPSTIFTTIKINAPTLIIQNIIFPAIKFTNVIIKAPTVLILQNKTVNPVTAFTTIKIFAATASTSATANSTALPSKVLSSIIIQNPSISIAVSKTALPSKSTTSIIINSPALIISKSSVANPSVSLTKIIVNSPTLNIIQNMIATPTSGSVRILIFTPLTQITGGQTIQINILIQSKIEQNLVTNSRIDKYLNATSKIEQTILAQSKL